MNTFRIGSTFYYYVIFMLPFDLPEKGCYTNIIKLSKCHEEPTANAKIMYLKFILFRVL